MKFALALALALLVPPQTANQAASAEVENFVKQALEDRFAANGVPDGGLLRGTRIAVLRTMRAAKEELTERSLPQRPGLEFYLLSMTEAQDEADRSSANVHFVFVDNARITGESAAISMGVDFVTPKSPKVVKLCCCTGYGQFARVDGRWKFVKWNGMACS